MVVLAKCPECGLESDAIRCPRCNTLKVRGCDGVCSACATACVTGKSGEKLKPPRRV